MLGVCFLCWLIFRCPFHPRVTAVASKRSRWFCQKCRWQVTAKHPCILRMWLCMKWRDMVHGSMVYTKYAPKRPHFHVAPPTWQPNSAVSTLPCKKLQSLIQNRTRQKRSESARELRTALTLRASLSGTFLQTLPDLVMSLKGHSLSPRSCPPTPSAPFERFGYW